MPTEQRFIDSAAAKARTSPLATAAEHIRHLVFAIKTVENAVNGRVKTEESAAVAEVLAELAAAPVPVAPRFLAIYIGTTNDTNGNPRRGWYVSRLDGAPMLENAPTGRKGETAPAWTCWVEEGYNGDAALYRAVCPPSSEPPHPSHFIRADQSREWRDRARSLLHETGRINVTPGEYRDARKLPRVGGAK